MFKSMPNIFQKLNVSLLIFNKFL